MKRFGDLLRELIEARGMTQEEFATQLGMSDGHPTRLINGTRSLDLEKLSAACAVLGLAPGSPARNEFERAAYLSRSPVEVELIIKDIEGQLENERKKLVRLRAELRRRGLDVPESGDGI